MIGASRAILGVDAVDRWSIEQTRKHRDNSRPSSTLGLWRNQLLRVFDRCASEGVERREFHDVRLRSGAAQGSGRWGSGDMPSSALRDVSEGSAGIW